MTKVNVLLERHRGDLSNLKTLFDAMIAAERFDRGRQEKELADALAEAVARIDQEIKAARY